MLTLRFFSPVLRQYACVQIALLTIVLLGMNTTWSSPMLVKLWNEDETPLSRPLTESEGAWLISMMPLVGLGVSFFASILQDVFGRKKALLIGFLPRLLACFLITFATEYWMILVGRGFSGLADFLTLSVLSAYTSEVANKEIRGQSGAMMQINSAAGMLVMLGIGPFISYFAINLLMTCVALAFIVPVLFLPESPVYLYNKGKREESIEVLTFLLGSEELAIEEYNGYSNKNEDETEVTSTLELFKDRTNIKCFIMVIILAAGQQFGGYNVVNLYLQTIFEMADTSLSSEISSLIIGLIQLFACTCTFFLSDRFKRKQILCTTIMAKLIGMIGLGTYFTIYESGVEITGFLNYIPIISAAIVIYGFNAGLGSLFWMLVAEILHAPVRAIGISMGVFVSASSIFILTLTFPLMNNSIGASGTYWIFSGCCAFLCFYIAMFVPETKGKTFAEIQTALGRKEKADGEKA